MFYKKDFIFEICKTIASLGFVVYLAESGTYGFFTDTTGARVVYFQCKLGIVSFSGAYKPSQYSGTGWLIGDLDDLFNNGLSEATKEDLTKLLYSPAPRWANASPKYTTANEHLDFHKSSRYKLFSA